jgi:hypothetical protein
VGPRHRRFLLVEQGVGSALFNIVLNTGIAWALFRHLDVVPLWGRESIGGDTLATCFFLPFFTALIVTPLVRRRVRRGGIDALPWTRASHPVLAWLPAGTLHRALALGGACLAAVGPLAVLALHGLSIGPLDVGPFIALKAGFAGLLALLVTPVISLWALAEP